MEKTYKNSDYVFMFQTKGVFFFFADICGQFYCPPNSVIFSLNDQYQQYTHIDNKKYFEEVFRKSYMNKTSVEKFCSEFELARDEMFKLKTKLNSTDNLSVNDFDLFIDLSKKMQNTYSNFEPLVTDKLFIESDPKTKEIIELVLNKKNVYREEFNQLFFNSDSCLFRIFNLVSKQTNISVSDLSYLSIDSFRKVLNGGPFVDQYKGIKDYVFISDNNKYTYYFGMEARNFISTFTNKIDFSRITEMHGRSVSKKGIFVGKVKKVDVDYNDLQGSLRGINQNEEGFILVTDSTVPEMVPLMSKSLAIVTNVGGLLSHAAITSRELNIPCVVGTENATQVFKDGDMVEVDADKGTVRIIK